MFLYIPLPKDRGIANYSDDSTPYAVKTNHKLVIEELEKFSLILFKWLRTNHIKVNADKSHLVLSANSPLTSEIDNNLITSGKVSPLIRIFPLKDILTTCVKRQVKN